MFHTKIVEKIKTHILCSVTFLFRKLCRLWHYVGKIMTNVSDKNCRENQNTHFVFSNLFFPKIAPFMTMWKNIVERGRPQMTIWRMRIACWIPKATNTHKLRISNIYWFFPTTTMVPRTRLNVTLYVLVHWLPHYYVTCCISHRVAGLYSPSFTSRQNWSVFQQTHKRRKLYQCTAWRHVGEQRYSATHS